MKNIQWKRGNVDDRLENSRQEREETHKLDKRNEIVLEQNSVVVKEKQW